MRVIGGAREGRAGRTRDRRPVLEREAVEYDFWCHRGVSRVCVWREDDVKEATRSSEHAVRDRGA